MREEILLVGDQRRMDLAQRRRDQQLRHRVAEQVDVSLAFDKCVASSWPCSS
jgi:hypothetical protein